MRLIKLTWACLTEVGPEVFPGLVPGLCEPLNHFGLDLHLFYYIIPSVFDVDTNTGSQSHIRTK